MKAASKLRCVARQWAQVICCYLSSNCTTEERVKKAGLGQTGFEHFKVDTPGDFIFRTCNLFGCRH